MDYLKPRIEYYRQRTFSEKMNVTFDFIRENWKPLLKYTFYLIMPICLIQTFAMNAFVLSYLNFAMSLGSIVEGSFGGSTVSNLTGFMLNYGITLLCAVIGSSILSGLVYAMMQTYATRTNGLQGVKIDDFKENLIRNAWRCLSITFFLIVICLIIIGFATLLAVTVSVFSLFLTVPLVLLLLLCLIPLSLVVPVYLFERDITFLEAFSKAWKLGIKTFLGLLGLIIILSIISYVIQIVTTMPWYLTIFIGGILTAVQEAALNQSVVYKFSIYILGLVQTYGSYVASIITIIGLAFQYFHAREKVEGVTIEYNIENFNQL